MANKVTPTRGESLLIWRRRAGLTQVQAAEVYGVSVDTYGDWETDARKANQPRRVLGQLKAHEASVIMRRRANLTQQQLAARLACSPLWVVRMEGGKAPADRLREYWGV
jgi:DNA-binding transcriptional regulator YiaG